MINLRQDGTEVLVMFAIPGFAAQAIKEADRLGWRKDLEIIVSYISSDPMMFQLTSVELMEGVFTSGALKFPDELDDPAVALHHRIMRDYSGPLPGTFVIYGQSVGELIEETLRRACDNLTREGLMDAAESIQDWQVPLARPGGGLRRQ